MLSTFSGKLVDHPCTGACYKFPPGWVHPDDAESKEADVEDVKTTKATRLSLIDLLRKEVPVVRLKPLESKMMCHCIALPCGYPVYGCSCGQKDVVIEMRYVPHGTGVPINQDFLNTWSYWNHLHSQYFKFKTTYHPEIWVSGHHTQECLFKMCKTVEEVYEAEAEAKATAASVEETTPTSNSAPDLTPFLDYSEPRIGPKGGGKRQCYKKPPKRGRKKSENHHVDVRVADPLPVSKSDFLFWDDVLDKSYTLFCACGEEHTIRLKSATQAFNSDFKCSTCGSVSGLANYIMQKSEERYEEIMYPVDAWDDYSSYSSGISYWSDYWDLRTIWPEDQYQW